MRPKTENTTPLAHLPPARDLPPQNLVSYLHRKKQPPAPISSLLSPRRATIAGNIDARSDPPKKGNHEKTPPKHKDLREGPGLPQEHHRGYHQFVQISS